MESGIGNGKGEWKRGNGRRGDSRLEPRAKRMRDEPWGLKEDRRRDAVVDAQRDRERAFSGEKLCVGVGIGISISIRSCASTLSKVTGPQRRTWEREHEHRGDTRRSDDGGVQLVRPQTRTWTRVNHVERCRGNPKINTYLEQHHRRIGHLHKRERRRREESLHDERRFERDVDQEHGGPGDVSVSALVS